LYGSCEVSNTKKVLFGKEFMSSNSFRFNLSILLMRVFGIQTREEAKKLIIKLNSFHSDQKIISELTNMYPEKKLSTIGMILCFLNFSK
jgi:hypothetical protein